MKKNLLIAIKILISVGLLAFLLYRMDRDQAAEALMSADISAFAMCVGIYLLIFCIAALRWNIVGHLTGASIQFWQTLRLLFAAMFFNQVMPTSIGGDVVRAWLASRQGIGLGQSASSVILDRSAGLISLFVVMAASAPFIAPRLPDAVVPWVMIAPWLALLAVAIGLAMASRLTVLFSRWSWANPIVLLLKGSRALWANGSKSALIFVLSFVIHGLNGVTLWVLADSIGVTLSYLEIMAFLPPVILLMTLPVSIAGWGVREGTVVALFGLIGGSTSLALVASILWGLAAAVASVVAGAVWLATKSEDEEMKPDTSSASE